VIVRTDDDRASGDDANQRTANEAFHIMETAMKYYDQALKTYADNGLRTEKDWAALGRDVKPGTTPRADTTHRGVVLPLFGRDQTSAVRREK